MYSILSTRTVDTPTALGTRLIGLSYPIMYTSTVPPYYTVLHRQLLYRRWSTASHNSYLIGTPIVTACLMHSMDLWTYGRGISTRLEHSLPLSTLPVTSFHIISHYIAQPSLPKGQPKATDRMQGSKVSPKRETSTIIIGIAADGMERYSRGVHGRKCGVAQ